MRYEGGLTILNDRDCGEPAAAGLRRALLALAAAEGVSLSERLFDLVDQIEAGAVSSRRQMSPRWSTDQAEGETLSTTEAAHLARCDRRTVQRAIDAGHLKASKIGRDWRIAPDDLYEWMKRGRKK